MAQSSIIFAVLLLMHCDLPFRTQGLVIPRTEPDTPPFENHDLDFLLTLFIDDLPLGLWNTITLALERRLVILWNGRRAFSGERGKHLLTQCKVVSRRLTTML